MILQSINSLNDLRKLGIDDLNELAREIREYIIDVVSQNGGHLASSLGVVELTLALHYAFNTPRDRLIWDVGHQSYAHKIITGRKDDFKNLRKLGGISGFPKMAESPFDTYNTGHSSTSLSLALGEAVGRDLKREKNKVIAVIGDGSLTGGMAFEALNHIGHLKKDIIIVLNDNEHSISKNVGALSEYLVKLITGSIYNTLRRRSYDIIRRIPRFGERLYRFVYEKEARLKGIFIPGAIFEEMGIRYFGPVDGHNMELMIDLFTRIKMINSGPRLIHVITRKGKGYEPAEKHPAEFHGVGPFNRHLGLQRRARELSYSDIAGKTIAEISKTDRRIVAITAAMKLGTGLVEFEKRSPQRFFDVGIAEQHAVAFASALALKGFKPFISIYSTFMQRAVDQIIHDVALAKAPVKLLIDRAGIVGEDGETHHGLFDIGIIRMVPGFMFLAPSNGAELRDMIYFAAGYDKGPVAIRYPRGKETSRGLRFDIRGNFKPGKLKKMTRGRDITLFAAGDMAATAMEVHRLLAAAGIHSTVVNLLTLKPLDEKGIRKTVEETRCFATLENGYVTGGVGEAIAGSLPPGLKQKLLFHAGFPGEFVTHGTMHELFALYGLDPSSIAHRIISLIKVAGIHEKRDSFRRISG